ncbi:hypothetical protein [Allokutzneria oryzae]|uniref:Uncharacterized protein n=1 Tax=Allokutzneria oryzae TaxID=1378989 RepID=A0ABV5ZQF6_9PSEU
MTAASWNNRKSAARHPRSATRAFGQGGSAAGTVSAEPSSLSTVDTQGDDDLGSNAIAFGGGASAND